jgi:hypothetical protein
VNVRDRRPLRRPPANRPLRELEPWSPPSHGRVAAYLLAFAVLGVAVAVAIGWLAGSAVDPEETTTQAPTEPALVGPATVEPGEGWRRVAGAGEATGLDTAATAVFALDPGSSGRAVVTLGETDHPSLIPAGLRSQLSGAPGDPAPALLLGRPAWLYVERPADGGRSMDITVLPTTAGVLAVACTATKADFQSASGCASDIRALELRGAQPRRPTADLPLRSRLPAAIAELDRRRVPLRETLQAATTRADQARTAERLAGAYGAAASSLAPYVPPGADATVVAALQRVQRAYERLGRAAAEGRRAGYARGRSEVASAERELRRQLAGLS